jgi:hypothetical protein
MLEVDVVADGTVYPPRAHGPVAVAAGTGATWVQAPPAGEAMGFGDTGGPQPSVARPV